jgi:hypothetical protein
LNLSKSGLGVSTGIKGLRISSGRRGTYLNAGMHGLYYRKKLSGTYRAAKANLAASPPWIWIVLGSLVLLIVFGFFAVVAIGALLAAP